VSHVDPEILALLALGETAAHPQDGRHLPGCPACQDDLSQLSGIVSLARAANGDHWLTDPPPGLWPRIAAEAGLDTDPADHAGPAITGPRPLTERRRRRADRPWWQRPAAAAVAALIVGAATALGIQHYRGTPPPTVTGRFALRPLAQFPQWKGASGTAVMERSTSGQSLKVMLKAPARPGFYEVWLLAKDGVKMISLGDLDPGHDGTFALPPGVDLRFYTRVDVSLQAFNGDPAHSAISVVRGTLP
jgi:hypothetical protein